MIINKVATKAIAGIKAVSGVVLVSIKKVLQVAQSLSWGAFAAATPTDITSTFHYNTLVRLTDSTLVLITSNSGVPYIVFVTVDGNTFTLETPIQVETGVSGYALGVVISATKLLVVYESRAVIVTVSGTTLSAQTPLTGGATEYPGNGLTKLTDTTILRTHNDLAGTNKGYAHIYNIDTNTITAGIALKFADFTINYPKCSRLTDTTAICVYSKYSDDKPYAVVLTNTDGTITATSPTLIENVAMSMQAPNVIALTSTKAIAIYSAAGTKGMACIINIDGTTITLGTPFEFRSTQIMYLELARISDTKVLIVVKSAAGPAGAGFAYILTAADTTTITASAAVEVTESYSNSFTLAAINSKCQTQFVTDRNMYGAVNIRNITATE